MKMRLESLMHAARQRYGAWAAIFILFAALCTLSVFSARDAREAAADPAKAESDSSVYYSPNDAASQETDRESAANSANFKEYETFFNGITFFPQEPPYLLTIPIYWEIKLY